MRNPTRYDEFPYVRNGAICWLVSFNVPRSVLCSYSWLIFHAKSRFRFMVLFIWVISPQPSILVVGLLIFGKQSPVCKEQRAPSCDRQRVRLSFRKDWLLVLHYSYLFLLLFHNLVLYQKDHYLIVNDTYKVDLSLSVE